MIISNLLSDSGFITIGDDLNIDLTGYVTTADFIEAFTYATTQLNDGGA